MTNRTTQQDVTELQTVLRTVNDVSKVLSDVKASTLTFTGTPQQISDATWLLGELDQPGAAPRQPKRLTRGQESFGVFFLNDQTAPQQMQETLTVLRTVLVVGHVFPLNSTKAFALRGTNGQVDQTEWLLQQFQNPQRGSTVEFPGNSEFGPRTEEYRLKVFFPAQQKSIIALQEQQTTVRLFPRIANIFSLTQPAAIALRGPKEALDSAEWLFHHLDQTPGSGPNATYPLPGTSEAMAVFYLAPATSHERLQALHDQLNSQLGPGKVFLCASAMAVVTKGNADQIAAVEKAVNP